MLLQPEKICFFFRTDTVQINSFHTKAMCQKQFCQSKWSWMIQIIQSDRHIPDQIFCFCQSLLTGLLLAGQLIFCQFRQSECIGQLL